jgi:hypothetical protein
MEKSQHYLSVSEILFKDKDSTNLTNIKLNCYHITILATKRFYESQLKFLQFSLANIQKRCYTRVNKG